MAGLADKLDVGNEGGTGDIRDDGIGSGLSIKMEDGVISLNGKMGKEKQCGARGVPLGHSEFEMPVACQVEMSSRELDTQT